MVLRPLKLKSAQDEPNFSDALQLHRCIASKCLLAGLKCLVSKALDLQLFGWDGFLWNFMQIDERVNNLMKKYV